VPSNRHGDPGHASAFGVATISQAAAADLHKKRQQLLSFLLRHGRIFNGGKHWSLTHLRWLAGQKCDHPRSRSSSKMPSMQSRMPARDCASCDLAARTPRYRQNH
jgi:hypothetical protein